MAERKGIVPSPSEAWKGYTELWKKSNAAKIGTGMTVVGAFFSLPLAAIGLGTVTYSAAWHSDKNPIGKK